MDRDIQYINYKEKNLRKKDAETENMKENHMYKNNDENNIEVINKSNRYVNNESNIQINEYEEVNLLQQQKHNNKNSIPEINDALSKDRLVVRN